MAALAPAPPSGSAGALAHETVCTTTLVPHPTRTHTWRLEGVTSAFFADTAVGKKQESPPFSALGVDWCLRLYANGKNPASAGHLSLLLRLLSPNTTVAPVVTLKVDGQAPFAFSSARAFCTKVPRTGDAADVLGFDKFLTHAKIVEAPDTYAPGGAMCFTVTLRERGIEERSNPTTTTTPSVVVPPPSLAFAWGALLASGERTDMTLVCGDERLKAHRLVLCARSPVFAAQLDAGPLQADASAVPVPPDITPHTLRRLLEFIYTDELEPASPEEATHLLNAADHYGMQRLFAICERALCVAVAVENAAETLTLAEQHGAAALKDAALRFVAANPVAVMATPGWTHLQSSRPVLITEAMHTMATGAPPPPPAPEEVDDAGDDAARRVRRRTRWDIGAFSASGRQTDETSYVAYAHGQLAAADGMKAAHRALCHEPSPLRQSAARDARGVRDSAQRKYRELPSPSVRRPVAFHPTLARACA
jgi:speckle-type POZ protein